MILNEIKDEIRVAVKDNYRGILEKAVNHFGMIAFLDGEIDTEEIAKYAAKQYTGLLKSKMIKWNKEARQAGKNVRRGT